MKDNLGGYFCIKRTALKKLDLKKIFYGYGEFYFRLLFYLSINHASMMEIPARYDARNWGKSKSNFFLLLFRYTLQAIILKFKST